MIKFAASPNLLVSVLIPIRPPASRRRQEVDRVHDRHGQYAILRAEIDRPDAANNLCGEIRRIHVSRLQRAHRHAAVRLNRQTQNHLAFQGWVITQLPVVQPVERRLVAIEHDLYFFVGAGRTRPAACLRSVGAGDRGDRADCAAYSHTTNPSASSGASASATHTSTPIASTSASSATTSHTAAQGGDVDATARSRRITRQQRACRGPAYVIGGNVTRIGSKRRNDGVLCQARDLVLECQDAGVSHLRLRFQCRRRSSPWGPSLTRPSRYRPRNGVDRDLRWTIENDVEFLVGLLAAKQRLRRYDHQQGQHEDVDRYALRHAACRRSPGFFENALCFHGCHQATTSIGRDKFDLQILNARFREINDAQNPLVVQAIVDGQEQRVLFRWPAAQNRRNARGQFGYRDLLIRQGHLTVLRDPVPFRGREDGARRGTDTQDQLGFGNLSRRIGGGSRDIDVVALDQEWHDDHKYDQQHEHHVDERRDVDFRLQTGAGIVAVELHDVTFLPRRRAWRSAPPRGSRPVRPRA